MADTSCAWNSKKVHCLKININIHMFSLGMTRYTKEDFFNSVCMLQGKYTCRPQLFNITNCVVSPFDI